jgi:predicted transposase YbfD/YdcC
LLPSPQNYFTDIPDPRRTTRNKLHKLDDIVMLTLCAVICGCEDWVSIEDFGCENEDWLREFLDLANGIPSHDTLSDVFGRIDREAFEKAFANWMQAGLPELAGRHISIDGKTLRRSRNAGELAPHLLSAFVTQERLALAVRTVKEKANEITAIPEVLAQLELRGAVVSIDAMGCQKSIAQDIRHRRADYVLTLKDNHPKLCEAVSGWFAVPANTACIEGIGSTEKAHGRLENREVLVCTDLDWLAQKSEWAGLSAVVMVRSSREVAGKRSDERRYYLSSLKEGAQIAEVIRHHWAIENSQHWVLDVQFGEDAHRAREKNSAANLAVIRRAALNLLRQDSHDKKSIRRRKMRAMSNLDYRREILFGSQAGT